MAGILSSCGDGEEGGRNEGWRIFYQGGETVFKGGRGGVRRWMGRRGTIVRNGTAAREDLESGLCEEGCEEKREINLILHTRLNHNHKCYGLMVMWTR